MTRRIWTRQPQTSTPLDYPGFVWVGSSAHASSNGIGVLTGTKPTFRDGDVGRGFGATLGVGSTDRITTAEKRYGTAVTWVFRYLCNGQGGGSYGRLFQKGTTTAGEEAIWINSGTQRLIYQRYNSAGTRLCDVYITDASQIDGKVHTLVISQSGAVADPVVFLDGVQQTIEAYGSASGNAANNTDPYIIGSRNAGDRNWDGIISLAARLDVAVLPSEAARLSKNPWAVFKPQAITAVFTAAGSGTQTLTPSLVTNSQTFYAPTVTPGAVSLAPALVTNSSSFFAPTVSSLYSLAPSLVTNAQIFYGPLVAAGVVNLVPSLVTNTQTFYNPTVSLSGGAQSLQPSLLTNTQIFYTATITVGVVTLAPTLVTNAQTFYAPTVLQQSNVELLPGLLTNEQVFFPPTVALAQEAHFGGWWPAHPYSRRQAQTKEEREEERRKLGIITKVPTEKDTLPGSEPRRRYQQVAERLLRQLPKASVPQTTAAYTLPAPLAEPTMAPDVLALVVDPTLLAAQRKRAFEQDLVYIVATLIS